jgi:hypothetical protein
MSVVQRLHLTDTSTNKGTNASTHLQQHHVHIQHVQVELVANEGLQKKMCHTQPSELIRTGCLMRLHTTHHVRNWLHWRLLSHALHHLQR